MENKQIIPLATDIMLEKIFGNPKNIPIVEEFLAVHLDLPLHIIRGNLELRYIEEDFTLPFKPVDFILKLGKYTINITILNLKKIENDVEIAIQYGCYLNGLQILEEIDDYDEYLLERTIQIQLRNFEHLDDETVKEVYLCRTKSGRIISKSLEFDTLNLKLAKQLYKTDKQDILTRWCNLFATNNLDELKRIIGRDLLSNKSKEQLISQIIDYSNNKEIKAIYEQ